MIAAGIGPANATTAGAENLRETAKPTGLSAADQSIYRAAFRRVDAGQIDQARAIALQAKDPLLAQVIRWIELSQARDKPNFPEVSDFLERFGHWPRQGRLQRAAELAMPEGLPWPQVLTWFQSRAPVTATGGMRLITALIAANQGDRARSLVRSTWITGNFDAPLERRFLQRYGRYLTPAEHAARLDRLLWERRRNQALRQAVRVGGSHASLAMARVALASNSGGVDAAIERVPVALRQDPGFVFERARWRKRRGRYLDTLALLDPPRANLPHPEQWWPLRHWAAREAFKRSDYRTAYRLAQSHDLKSGVGFAQGEWLAGWLALRFLGQAGVALDHFKRLHDGVTTAVSRARAAYWAGRAAEAQGLAEAQRVWYRRAAAHATTYYGQLAAARLGQPAAILADRRAEPSPEQRRIFEQKQLVLVVRQLGQVGEKDRTRPFVHTLLRRAKTPAEYRLVAELARDLDRFDLVVAAAKAARRDDIVLPDLLYPLPPITGLGPRDAALVLAVARQESAFHSTAVSRAGARGLMQLLPSTAQQVAHKLKLPYSRHRLTEDPPYNLRLGRAYLTQLLVRYGGSHVLALAAYNAGPHRVDQWLDTYGDPRHRGVDLVDWIESIPIAETRNYVQRILESLLGYRKALEPKAVAASLIPALHGTAAASVQTN